MPSAILPVTRLQQLEQLQQSRDPFEIHRRRAGRRDGAAFRNGFAGIDESAADPVLGAVRGGAVRA